MENRRNAPIHPTLMRKMKELLNSIQLNQINDRFDYKSQALIDLTNLELTQHKKMQILIKRKVHKVQKSSIERRPRCLHVLPR